MYYLYLGSFFLAALAMTAIAGYAWRHRQVSSAASFAWLLTCGAVVMWGTLLLDMLPLDSPWIAWAFSLRMLGLIPMPLVWFCFALDYSGRSHWLTRNRLWALGGLTGLNVLIYLSNPLHHWFFISVVFGRSGFMTTVVGTDGPWFYVHTLNSYALTLFGMGLLIQFALSTFRLYRFQALLLVLGACGPVIPLTLTTFRITRVSYLPIGTLVTAVLYGQAIFRYRLLNLASVARHILVDRMNDGMLVLDTQETVVDLNPAMARFLGTRKEAPIGRSVWEVLPPGAAWESWLRASSDAQATVTHTGPDEHLCVYDVQVSPFRDRSGQISGRLVVLHDITERQQAAEALAARNAELDAFAHTVAHDLKNPLTAVVGYSALLLSRHDKLTPEQQRTTLDTIHRQANRMTKIIDELLLLASLRKSGDVPFTPLAMEQIVAEVLERLALAIEAKQAQITLPESWPAVVGYAAWVEEIWANYVSNALKYGGDPPRIALGYSIVDFGLPILEPELQALVAKIENPHSKTAFWVRDNGAGLTPEAQAQLFTPFTRLDQISAQGHGLGLSIVHRISEKLGGQVGVNSAPGAGSTFWFTLPRVDLDQVNPSQ